MQSEQHAIYRSMVGGGQEAQTDMEETDGEQLPCCGSSQTDDPQ